jgi:spermidine synthase
MAGEELYIPIRGRRLGYLTTTRRHLFSQKTEFQQIDLYENDLFGKVMTLDGHIQLTTLDEHAYHEALVHIPMLSIDEPRSALVVGGGDGGVIRELCKHRTLDRIHMVEIDVGVVEFAKEHLPELSDGAFEDPRVGLFIEDAFQFMKRVSDSYDLIVIDSTDVFEDEEDALSERLFTTEFYSDCERALAQKGFIVTQADNAIFCPYGAESALEPFQQLFPRSGLYNSIVPSFGGFSAYAWASKSRDLAPSLDQERASNLDLRYLTPEMYALAFAHLPFKCPI